MKKELFKELLESVRHGGAILRGEKKPARIYEFSEPDVRRIRDQYGLSQHKFASLMGISVATLRNWEQGRRKPEGAARILLRVAARHPEAVLDAVNNVKLRNKDMKSLKLPKEIEPLLETAETDEEDTLVFTDRKRPVAALVSLRNVDRESLRLSMNRDFLTIINKARREIRARRSVSSKAIERKLVTGPNPRIQSTRRKKGRRAADA